MNETQSVEKTRTIWSYLRDNPDFDKYGAYISLGLDIDMNNCPLCQYARRVCSKCPLLAFWLETTDDDYELPEFSECPCQRTGTPYDKWRRTDFATVKSRCANQIVKACEDLQKP